MACAMRKTRMRPRAWVRITQVGSHARPQMCPLGTIAPPVYHEFMAGPFAVVRTWGEMIKFSHSVYALPFALVATVLAGRQRVPAGPTAAQLLLILGSMVTARSFAMTFNRIADLAHDRRNPRTQGRPLVIGAITLRQAWLFAAAAAILFVAACGGFWLIDGNAWPLLLSGPVLGYLAAYSYAKRFTRYAHFFLGAAIASAPVAAWIAIHPASLGVAGLLLMLAGATWIAGFDIIYACQDVDVDRRDGLHSLPARIGIGPALWVSRGCHVVTVAALLLLWLVESLGGVYLAGVGIVTMLLALEQSVVRADDLSRVNLAFFSINGVVGLVFGAATIADVLLRA